MKIARLWFLVLLAVLLPIRGAVAGAMLCPVGGSGVQQELRLEGEVGQTGHPGIDDPASAAPSAGPAQVDGSADHHGGHDHGAVDKCNVCSVFCSLMPLLSDLPELPEPLALPAVKFADLSAPAPSFLSDGQDRPPRAW